MRSGAISDTIGQVAGDEDDRAIFADGAREGEGEAGERAPAAMAGKITRAEGREARGAETGGGFFGRVVDIGEHGLDGADHEGQSDEDERHEDAERREGDLDAEEARAGQPIDAMWARRSW